MPVSSEKMSDLKRKHKPNALLAFLLAWAVPGAGHVYAGKPYHGLVIFLVISATFWAGMGMGGVMTVDNRTERWWFIANMMTGVHGVTSYYRREAVCDKLLDKLLEKTDEDGYANIRDKNQEDIRTEKANIGELKLARDELSGKLRNTMLSGEERSNIEQRINAINNEFMQTKREILRLESRQISLKQELLDEAIVEEGLALVPPTSTVARAYSGIAGMLNMVCIFDAGLIVLMGSVRAAGRPRRGKA